MKEAVHEMVERAIRLDGTCTGEHGVGVGKIEYLETELGVGTVNLMETLKRTSEWIFLDFALASLPFSRMRGGASLLFSSRGRSHAFL